MGGAMSGHPEPKYPVSFGCEACRSLFGWDTIGVSQIPDPLRPVATLFDSLLLPWTRPFHVCRKCESIWVISYNPKDGINDQTPTPAGMKKAIAPDAPLSDLIEPLFSWAPVDEMTEHGLWELEYEPQELYDRLTVVWRDERIDMNRRADILRQLVRLLGGHNPYHRRLQAERGWMIEDLPGFEADLQPVADLITTRTGGWEHYPRYAEEDVGLLRGQMSSPKIVRGVTPPMPVLPTKEEVDALDFGSTDEERLENFIRVGAEIEAAVLTHEGPASLGRVWGRTGRLLQNYWRYLPGGFVGWFLVERVALRTELGVRGIAVGFIMMVTLVLMGAAVARNAEVVDLALIKVAWRRLSVIAEYGGFILLVVLVAWLHMVVWETAGWLSATGRGGFLKIMLPVWTGLLALRFWPLLAVPFMSPLVDEDDMSAQIWWKEPTHWTAWKLTRSREVVLRLSLPWVVVVGFAVGLSVGIGEWGGAGWRSVILYPVVLPGIMAFSWAMAEELPEV